MKKKTQKFWEQAELDIVRENYPSGGFRLTQQALLDAGFSARTKSSIGQAARKQGLKSLNNTGRFQKGQPAFNKGLGMSEELRQRVQHTWFKKGEPNHNLLEYDLAVSYRPAVRRINNDYWHIRVAKAKWTHLHVWCFLQHNDDPPKGWVIRMKDKAAFDATVRSIGFTEKPPKQEPKGHWRRLKELAETVQPLLECIPMQENAIRNSGSINLPDSTIAALLSVRNPELREAIKQQPMLLAIKRQQLINQRKIKSIQNG